ncbi:MAG: phosphoribosylformylglycinamidine synthase subunit PurL [Halobacteria archaeon]
MKLSDEDYGLVEDRLGREPNSIEEALFVNLWSEHCAYRSSRTALADLPNESERVVIGPGDDAAVVEFDDRHVLAVGMESHNHPSYVDPYDGAATGVGGIVRDILSMGADPIALLDTIYFGDFSRRKSRYLFEGVVEGISEYGNSIGVPTVGGQTYFDESYNGNPLVNVVCVGLAEKDDVLTAELQEPGNLLVLVGASTGRDGLGGASFASEDLSEDAESEDRPAVQVGDPYTEKLLIDASREIREYALSSRDLGAAGLSGASSEMAAKSGLGAVIQLEDVHLREEGMTALEILLSESQERMLYEVREDDVQDVREICEKFDLESSIIGEVTDEGYVATFEGETVVDLPAEFLADGAPTSDLERAEVEGEEEEIDRGINREDVLETLRAPNVASKEWVYRQYDHEVQTRTAVKPGDDAAVLEIDGKALCLSAGCDSRRVSLDPRRGGREVVVENATNLAAKGAEPIALVNCLNFGNPEYPEVYGEFREAVAGLGDGARELDVPVVGGNVSLYNQSEEFGSPVNPTPSVGMIGVTPEPDAATLEADLPGQLVLVDLRGSDELREKLEKLAETVRKDHVSASHDVSTGGLVATAAEMMGDRGVKLKVEGAEALYGEEAGRCLLLTEEPGEVEERFDSTERVGETVSEPQLKIESTDGVLELESDVLTEALDAIEEMME